jgi:hypothetical protein
MKYTSRYPGVKPFETEEQHIFFGRSADVQSLYELVGVEKMVLFYSKSGLGKTSLINAGLIPKLKNDKHKIYNPVTIRLGVYSKVNNISPKAKIIEILQKYPGYDSLKDFPELIENTLAFCIKSLQFNDPGQIHVLIFDQFEELFTYPDDQIEELKKDLHELLYLKTSACFRDNIMLLYETKPDAFSEEQLNMLTSAVNIRILFSIRSDKVSMLNRLTDYLPNVQRTFLELKPLTTEEARNAIQMPAKADGDFPCPKFEFAPSAVDKILNDLSDNGKQPIETFQLQLVCQYAENLILKNPGKLSVLQDDLGDIKDIHQSFYNNLMAELPTESAEEKLRLHILLEERFIYEPEKRRLPVLKGMILKNISEQTLSALEKTHLIRSEPYQDSFTYELSHDTLVEPILKSFHKRKEEEEKQKEEEKKEAERKKAEEERIEEEKRKRKDLEERFREKELQAIRIKARRQKILIFVISVGTVFSLGMATFGFVMLNDANNAIEKFHIADKKRRELEVQKLISDAKSYEMYGYFQDAERSIDSALQIDSTSQLAKDAMDTLLTKYSNRKL